ncbi:hypothetical protein [Actinokineospora iranica]|uniref:Uncharacterized protein n=1 Tax=Actinokineospora iranica TaxID=1271860 RepID=A0A1G6YFM7_9PSEU|nr:hypothetical protein [Actinokineospora iranica]SDD89170.1 hypothetical protein SAMN05216174_12165 [Actinokineospora iranica]
MTKPLFRLTMLVKGADGAPQVLGAAVLGVVPPPVVTGVADAVITRDLACDHNGTLALHLSRAARTSPTAARGPSPSPTCCCTAW